MAAFWLRVQPRRGNRQPFMAPHGCYRCKGDDRWVNISVASDEEWRSFCIAIGDPPWTKEERLADSLSRHHNQDELDRLIEEWTIQHDHYDVMNTLQKAGVAAGAVLTSAELLTDPHLTQIPQHRVFLSAFTNLAHDTLDTVDADLRIIGRVVGRHLIDVCPQVTVFLSFLLR